MPKAREIVMGSIGYEYRDGVYQSVTFCVTEECNLRCKYCYMEHKNSFRTMTLDTAKKIIDFLLETEPAFDAVVLDFIGGEPLLEIRLIHNICDYFVSELSRRNHKWFGNYRFSISTNGLLYHTPEVQEFIIDYCEDISTGITIDGTKEKHDLQRVDKQGKGSYDRVYENVVLWLEQFPDAITKVTFASDDLKYLKDSIIHLWDIGLKIIPANIVYEDVWKDGDEIIFEDQLRQLADYIIENELWWDHSVRFFSDSLGHPIGNFEKQRNFCGCGKMMAFDCDGNIYPCIRFMDFCLHDPNETSAIIVGNIENGFNAKQEIFEYLTIGSVNDGECESCNVASGCFSCSGNNYSCSVTHTVFKRTKFHCKMQKAHASANRYFWDRLSNYLDSPTPYELTRAALYQKSGYNLAGANYLYFMLDESGPSHCMYLPKDFGIKMDSETFSLGLQYVYENNMVPVFLGNPDEYMEDTDKRKLHIIITYEKDILESNIENPVCTIIPVFNTSSVKNISKDYPSVILHINASTISELASAVAELSKRCHRINIIKDNFYEWTEDDISEYEIQLSELINLIEPSRLNISSLGYSIGDNFCEGGVNEYTLAPDGKFYICPAHALNDFSSVGSLESGILDHDADVLTLAKTPKCADCTNTHCVHCSYQNLLATGTVNIASSSWCKAASIETTQYS